VLQCVIYSHARWCLPHLAPPTPIKTDTQCVAVCVLQCVTYSHARWCLRHSAPQHPSKQVYISPISVIPHSIPFFSQKNRHTRMFVCCSVCCSVCCRVCCSTYRTEPSHKWFCAVCMLQCVLQHVPVGAVTKVVSRGKRRMISRSTTDFPVPAPNIYKLIHRHVSICHTHDMTQTSVRKTCRCSTPHKSKSQDIYIYIYIDIYE